MAKNTKMTHDDAARIQSTQTKGGNDAGKGSFPARAQAAAARNEPASGPTPAAKGASGASGARGAAGKSSGGKK